MARCKECIHGECCSVFTPIRTTLCNGNADEMCKLFKPIADVVPKSEVDSEIKVWQELYADTVSKWEKAYEELEIKLENAKAEVARKIFEDIENQGIYHFAMRTYSISELKLAKLKKKYIGGQK